jgi:hypothetical protein
LFPREVPRMEDLDSDRRASACWDSSSPPPCSPPTAVPKGKIRPMARAKAAPGKASTQAKTKAPGIASSPPPPPASTWDLHSEVKVKPVRKSHLKTPQGEAAAMTMLAIKVQARATGMSGKSESEDEEPPPMPSAHAVASGIPSHIEAAFQSTVCHLTTSSESFE